MPRRVHLLDLDPDLAEGMDGDRERLAHRHLVARLERVSAGRWTPQVNQFGAMDGLGLLVVEGVAIRQLSLAHRAAAELLGPGDIMRPWEDDGEHAAYPFASAFRVIEPLSLAVLDQDVTRTLVHFPEVVSRLMGRVMTRSRRVAGYLVIAQIPSVDTRLHVALWHMADRFGRVRTDGVVVPLQLTHEMLGLIVGARRPSVTAAMGRLVERGLVRPLETAGWLLLGEPPQEIPRVPRTPGRAAV
jgi:CRP/FNR family cyclic AMP-dependent transcriptional regulator